MHAVARLVLHPLIPNIQASWVKLGGDGVVAALWAGANDLGGTLMDELKRPGFSGGSFHWAMQPYRGSRGLHSNCLRPQRAGCAR